MLVIDMCELEQDEILDDIEDFFEDEENTGEDAIIYMSRQLAICMAFINKNNLSSDLDEFISELQIDIINREEKWT